MDITLARMEQLARLARLTLTPQEGEALQGQLEQMVGYLHTLSPVQGEQATPQQACVLRCDQQCPCPDGEKLLSQAPQVRDGYVVTPKSVGEGGEA